MDEPETLNLFGEAPKPIHPIAKMTDKQRRAIVIYARQHELRMSLSNPPTIFFINGKGKTIKIQLKRIESFYENYKKEIAREKARLRRAVKKHIGTVND